MSSSKSSGNRPLSDELFVPALIIYGIVTVALATVMHGYPLSGTGILHFVQEVIAKRAWGELVLPVLITASIVAGIIVLATHRKSKKKSKADTPLSLQQQLDRLPTSEEAWKRTLSPHAALNAASAVRPDLPKVNIVRVRDGHLPPETGVTLDTLIHYATPIGWVADPDLLSKNWHSVLDEGKRNLRFKARRKYPAWISNELSVVVLGPPRSGKNLTLVNSIAALHDGPAVITGARSDIVTAVAPYRTMRTGKPCVVLDPEGQLSDRHPWIKRGYVDLLHGCASPSVAKRRFQHLASTKQRIQRIETGGGGDGRGVEEFYVSQAAQILAGIAVVESYEARREYRPANIQNVARRFRTIISSKEQGSSRGTLAGLADELNALLWQVRLDQAYTSVQDSAPLSSSRALSLTYLLGLYEVADQFNQVDWLEAQAMRFGTASADTYGMLVSGRQNGTPKPVDELPLATRLFAMASVGIPALQASSSTLSADPRYKFAASAAVQYAASVQTQTNRALDTYGLLNLATHFAKQDTTTRSTITARYNALVERVQPLQELWLLLSNEHATFSGSVADCLFNVIPGANGSKENHPERVLIQLAFLLPFLVDCAGEYLPTDGPISPLAPVTNALVPLLELETYVLAYLLNTTFSHIDTTYGIDGLIASQANQRRSGPPQQQSPSLPISGATSKSLHQWAQSVVSDAEFTAWITQNIASTAAANRRHVERWLVELTKGDRDAAELESMVTTLRSQVDRNDDTYQTFMTAFADGIVEIIDSPLVRGITEPSPDVIRIDPYRALDPDSTVFMIGSATNQRLLAPIIVAFISDVLASATLRRAEQQQQRRDGNARLAPPLGLILDEFTSLAPLPPDLLTEILTTGSGSGIRLVAVIQSMRLVEQTYGEQAARGILDNAGITIALPGLTENDTEQLSKRVGNARLSIHHETGDEDKTTSAIQEETIIAPHQIAQLPRNLDNTIEPDNIWSSALVIRQGYPALIVELPAFIMADWYRVSQAAYKAAVTSS